MPLNVNSISVRRFVSCLLALILGIISAASARPKPVPHHGRIFIPKMLPTILPEARPGFQTVLRGKSSWYGKFFQGMETASGELYDRFQYTCAHKKLPFNTRLRVTNLKTGLTVVVRVTDRGPYRKERIIDLSEKAAGTIGLIDAGQAPVIAVIVPETTPLGPTDTPTDLNRLQAGDPYPEAPFAAYLLPLLTPSVQPVAPVALVKEPLGPLAGSAGRPLLQNQIAIEVGLLTDLALIKDGLGSFLSVMPGYSTAAEVSVRQGQPDKKLTINQLESWLAAETVRRNLQVWSNTSTGLTHPGLPSPTNGPSLTITD